MKNGCRDFFVVLLFGALLLVVVWLFAGCGILLHAAGAGDEAKMVMEHVNARGCIYVRAAANFSGSATMLLVGTWGLDPPVYSECWIGLPVAVP